MVRQRAKMNDYASLLSTIAMGACIIPVHTEHLYFRQEILR